MQYFPYRILVVTFSMVLLTSCHRYSILHKEETPDRYFGLNQFPQKKAEQFIVILYRRFTDERHRLAISIPADSCNTVTMSRLIYGPPKAGKKIWKVRTSIHERITYDSLAYYPFSNAERNALNALLAKQKEMGGCADTIVFKTPPASDDRL